ncbi:MAG: hypothetical protein ACI8RD_001890 [Bacillariaceae sp.]|jgi:hypothetical protein
MKKEGERLMSSNIGVRIDLKFYGRFSDIILLRTLVDH